MTNRWNKVSSEMARLMDELRIEDENGFLLAQDLGFERFIQRLEECRSHNSHVYIISDENCEHLLPPSWRWGLSGSIRKVHSNERVFRQN